jgi:hypothetical protein
LENCFPTSQPETSVWLGEKLYVQDFQIWLLLLIWALIIKKKHDFIPNLLFRTIVLP